MTLSLTINETLKRLLIAAHLNAVVVFGGDGVAVGIQAPSPFPPPP